MPGRSLVGPLDGPVLDSTGPEAARSPGTYEIRTYGCQMNMHDSERLAGLLEEAGYRRAAAGGTPDVVVFNTCAVRENADNRLYGNLGQLLPVKNAHPGLQIAVGGCLAQKDQELITARAPWVDVVFGTHNIGSLPVLLERARVQRQAQVEIVESLERFPSVLPARRESAYSAWVAISVGLQQHLHVLHRAEPARPRGGPPAGRRARRDPGAGRRRRGRGHAARPERQLLRRRVRRPAGVREAAAGLRGDRRPGAGPVHLAASPGFHRRRHRRDGADARTSCRSCTCRCSPARMPCCGRCAAPTAGTSTWRSWARSARRSRTPRSRPTSSSDFPGETESDFADTLDLVRRARFSGAFTFRYSVRPGTPAAAMDGQVPAEVRPGAVRAAGRAGRGDVAGREPAVRRPAGRGTRGRRRGPQGRGDAPDVRPGPRQPAGAFRPRGLGGGFRGVAPLG